MVTSPFRWLVLAAALVVQPGHAGGRVTPVAITKSGPVRGAEHDRVRSYLGIPYAGPAGGAYRWRAPQPVQPWTKVRDATRFGPSCWQAVSGQGFGPWSHEYVVQGPVSEDCLTLNVWTPVKAAKSAVLVWIHGGGFNSGSGAIPIYDGAALARRGIVVVTINYRVNIFGFLVHPELTAEAGGGATANFGLQDIVAALRWTRANIASFGGDPARVTIAGQSAGAAAVHDLIAAPSARGLFSRAIAQSGLPVGRSMPSLAAAEQEGSAFGREKGSTTLAGLRATPAEALQPSIGANIVRFTPVVDGVLLPQAPDEALESSNSADVPVLAGFNADEGSAAASYPDADPKPQRDRWRANLDLWAGLRARNGRAPTYAYYFGHVTPGPQSSRWRAFHSSEVPYVFGTLGAAPERGYTAVDRALSGEMANYWTNFVKTGDPNGPGLPRWSTYAGAGVGLRNFGNTPPTSRY